MAPLDKAQVFIASATASAVETSSFPPVSTVFLRLLYTALGSRWLISLSENTFSPQTSLVGVAV